MPMRIICFVGALVIGVSQFLALGAHAADEKEKLVLKVLEVTQMDGILKQATKNLEVNLMTELHRIDPDIPKEISDIALKTIAAEVQLFFDEILPSLVGIFIQHYTEEELRELITFYESPLGRKLIAKQPGIFTDFQSLMFETLPGFSQNLVAKVKKNLIDAGYGE